jgi:acetyltransferase-like isoleucine patch superfamily enzyme
MLEIVLTQEDANTERALLAEWLVEDRREVAAGDPVCVVETTKATVEVEAPGAGTLVRLAEAGVEVELGHAVAVIVESADELAVALERQAQHTTEEPARTAAKATRKAVELAEAHGIDLDAVAKAGFITTADVELLIAEQAAAVAPAHSLLAGVITRGVTLPGTFGLDEGVGVVEPRFLESVRADPAAFRSLSSEEKCEAYRSHGAAIGEGVVLGEGSLVDAPRIVLGDGVEIGARSTVRCAEVVAVGTNTRFADDLELLCRRAFVGESVWAGRSIRFGGGGHRDPWAILAIGDLAFVGDEVFVNVCRPVLIGREVFLTMRAMIVTHNIGHSALEGFENRFAPVVLEDRSQVGLSAVVYAGCRVGAEAIVGSNSYVVSDIPPGAFAVGVPAKVAGSARHKLSRPRQVELARQMIDALHEQLALRGHDVSAISEPDLHGLEVALDGRRAQILFTPSLEQTDNLPESGVSETVVLTLEHHATSVPDDVVVFDLLERRVHGTGDLVADSVREFCRKRGIRFEPGPWRYRGGLI